MSNENNLVDIIMPNFNKGNFLEKAINSVINQTFKRWHLYIIDDNSNDISKIIIDKFKSIKNITIINLKKTEGPGFCRNYVINKTSSKYISFLDSDDYWNKDKLKEQIEFMEENNYSFSYSDYVPFTEKNGNESLKKKVIVPSSFNFEKFTKNTSIAMSSVIIQRSVLGEIKFENLKICEDYLYKCEILKKIGNAFKCPNVLMYYRITSKSLQSSKLRNVFWIWHINKNHNKFTIFQNLKSIFLISINSLKKYGFK